MFAGFAVAEFAASHSYRNQNRYLDETPVKEEKMQAYCMKCREKVEINHERTMKLKNGRVAVRGICCKCFNQVVRLVKA